MVRTSPGAHPARIAGGSDPAFAPTGHLLAYAYNVDTNGNWNPEVRLLDADTGKSRLLRARAADPHWSRDGRKIALVDVSPKDFDALVEVVDAQTGQRVLWKQQTIGPSNPLLSPNGRYIAYSPHMSRPKPPGVVADMQTGSSAVLPHEGSPVLDWSPDSSLLLWTRLIIAPQNDGVWLWTEVWMSQPNATGARKLDDGGAARFTPDGKHVLYIRARTPSLTLEGDLCSTDLHGRNRRVLAHGVSGAIAVWRSSTAGAPSAVSRPPGASNSDRSHP